MYENIKDLVADTLQFKNVICLSHLRWNFVYQRPQHLMSRYGRISRVFYFEEPIFTDRETRLNIGNHTEALHVLTPEISHQDRERGDIKAIQRKMLDTLISDKTIDDFVLWYYTPMAMDFTKHLKPTLTIFDCMDELSAFKFAPSALLENERRLIESADLVFTGGQSLYESKRDLHPKVFPFPSSIDVAHFLPARKLTEDPLDQATIPHPRFGFCGVIDERFDPELVSELAKRRPDWHFVMVGPIVKITEDELPKAANIHYLGGKDYEELPAYFAGWDVALMPFAMNDSTKFISPTKTPEYLAAGLQVISTPVRDVVRPYGNLGLVSIAANAEGFEKAGEAILKADRSEWIIRVDEFLKDISWDKTWRGMTRLMNDEISDRGFADLRPGVTTAAAF